MRDFLVFRLYGPMISWGNPAVGGERPTAQVPSRSALLGLLAAALGIRREDEASHRELRESVRFGIKQLSAGSLLRDYHTTQVPPQRSKVVYRTRKEELEVKGLSAILSQRDYRCDGLWIVAVWLTKSTAYTLDVFEKAIQKPVFTLYLGRKSCPVAMPLSPVIRSVPTLKAALDYEFPSLTASHKSDSWYLRRDGWVSYHWEGTKNTLGVDSSRIMRSSPWDEPLSRVRWQFGQRLSYQLTLQEE